MKLGKCYLKYVLLALLLVSVISIIISNILSSSHANHEKIHSNILSEFVYLMWSFHIRVCLIEPSVLYNVLPPTLKDLLVRRGFNLSEFLGAENIVTLAVTENYAMELENESSTSALKSAGFRHWTLYSNNPGIVEKPTLLPTHHFYVRDDQVLQVVIFYHRSEYFWHGDMSDIPDEVLKVVKEEDLVFGRRCAAFERFTEVPIDLTGGSLDFYIPSNPEQFLFQIPTSRFLECNAAIGPSNVTLSKSQIQSSVKFKRNTLNALQELKKRFHPMLISFWLACGTLLGWYRECNLIEHTTDVDFAAWATVANDDLIEIFKDRSSLYIGQRFGLVENGLEYSLYYRELKVDVFFVYDDGKNFWCPVHKGGLYFYRQLYPKFSLCSAELLGHKVLIPCEAESVIRVEYGPDWRTPVKDWDYLNSPLNIGLKYYWTEEEKPRSYFEFRK